MPMTGQTKDLAATRQAQGLSVLELAVRTGLNPRTIERIEAGEANPHPATRRVLSLALDTDIEFGDREAA